MATFDRFNIKVVAGLGLCGAAMALSPDAGAAPFMTGGYACIQGAAGEVGAGAPLAAGGRQPPEVRRPQQRVFRRRPRALRSPTWPVRPSLRRYPPALRSRSPLVPPSSRRALRFRLELPCRQVPRSFRSFQRVHP